MRGSQSLENGQQLFARGLIVPFAIAPHDFQKLIHRFLVLVCTDKRHCEIKPQLKILWDQPRPAF